MAASAGGDGVLKVKLPSGTTDLDIYVTGGTPGTKARVRVYSDPREQAVSDLQLIINACGEAGFKVAQEAKEKNLEEAIAEVKKYKEGGCTSGDCISLADLKDAAAAELDSCRSESLLVAFEPKSACYYNKVFRGREGAELSFVQI